MSDTIVVNASGTLAGGVGAHFRLLVDGAAIGEATAGAGLQAYSFGATLAPGSAHSIQVVFDNDAVVGGQDRNLLLQSIAVNGVTVPATDPRVVYHATGGPGDLHGTGNMYWNGSAEFSLPASFFPGAPAPAPAPAPVPAPTPGPAPAPSGAAYYVSTTGSDGSDGSAAHPFATLGRALAAMEGSAIHTTYVQGGTYYLSSTLNLGAAASGMTFKAFPGQAPVLDGGASGLGTLIALNGANGVTLSGLTFAHAGHGGAVSLRNANDNSVLGNHFLDNGMAVVLSASDRNRVSGNQIDNSAQAGIEAKDGSDHNLFDSNLITGVSASGMVGGGFFLHGANNNTISHNVVQNTAGVGIAIENWDASTVNLGNTVSYNVVRNTGTGTVYDSGSIYVLGRSRLDTGTVINNNLVDGTGRGGDAHTVAIYLDDYASGVTVTNNIARNVGTHALQIHGGRDVTVQNNIFDLGSGANSAIFFQDIGGDAVANVDVSRNVITSSRSYQLAYDDYSEGHFNIRGNAYWMSGGQQMILGGVDGRGPNPPDPSPSFGNPNFRNAAAGDYTLGAGSAAPGIGFQAIDQAAIGLHPTTEHWYM